MRRVEACLAYGGGRGGAGIGRKESCNDQGSLEYEEGRAKNGEGPGRGGVVLGGGELEGHEKYRRRYSRGGTGRSAAQAHFDTRKRLFSLMEKGARQEKRKRNARETHSEGAYSVE